MVPSATRYPKGCRFAARCTECQGNIRQLEEAASPELREVKPAHWVATWNAPGKVVVRGGYGTFYDWYDTSLYDQTLRVNGVSQRDLLIINPGYPNPLQGADPTVLPGGR